MSVVNEIVPPRIPVFCNFWFEQTVPLTFSIGTSHFPYSGQQDTEKSEHIARASDARYKVYSNYINTNIQFDAIDSKSEGHPKVIVPQGVSIVNYLWHFGDGTTARGPVVSHDFKVPDPEISVALIVTDTRGLNFSCLHPLNLLFGESGTLVPHRVRV